MSYFKTEDGQWKSSNIVAVLTVLVALVLVSSIAIFYEPSTTEVQLIPLNVTVNNYYTIDGVSSPLNTMGCHLLELTSGEGAVLVCRK